MKGLVIFLLLISSVFAVSCTGFITHLVPAVVGDGGGMVPITVKLISGPGNIYLTTVPHTGVSTQTSAEDAIRYSFSLAGEKRVNCDVLVNIEGKKIADYVDGPSAGAAFTVLTYSALVQKPVRKDATITGAIDSSGKMIRVGGIYEKAKAAIAKGFSYFVTPPHTIHEKILLSPLEKKYGIRIIETETADEAIEFLTENKTPAQKNILITQRTPLPKINYSTNGIESFRGVVFEMIRLENKSILQLPETSSDVAQIKQRFIEETIRQAEILEKGYLFTAANEAFLNYISASTVLKALQDDRINISEKKQEIRNCINSIPNIFKQEKNYEVLIGADLRRSWAVQKISSIKDDSNNGLVEERYFTYNELMYADAWCAVSKSLTNAAIAQGTENKSVNENAWRFLAKDKIESASSLSINTTNSELNMHLESAKLLFDSRRYGAAIYDAVFLISSEKVERELLKLPKNKWKEQIQVIAQQNRTSYWGKIYQSQGAFLLQGGEEDKKSAYRILSFAKDLDEVTEQMKTLLERGDEENNQKTVESVQTVIKKQDEQKEEGKSPLVCSSIFGFIMLAVFALSLKTAKK